MEDVQKHKLAVEDILTFILGGKAIFTMVNTLTGTRFTYKVKRKKVPNDKFHQTNQPYWVKVLTGNNNETDYTFVGTIWKEPTVHYAHGRNSAITTNAPSVKGLQWLINNLTTYQWNTNIEVWHEGCCARCGRLLTVPESIESGFGPECIKYKNKK